MFIGVYEAWTLTKYHNIIYYILYYQREYGKYKTYCRKISKLGFEVTNDVYWNYASHGIFNLNRSGHGSLVNKKLYDEEESLAKNMIDNKDY